MFNFNSLLDPALWAAIGAVVFKGVNLLIDRFLPSADARLAQQSKEREQESEDESQFRDQLMNMASAQAQIVEGMSKSLSELTKAYNDSQVLNSKMEREIQELRTINKQLTDKVVRLEAIVAASQGEQWTSQ